MGRVIEFDRKNNCGDRHHIFVRFNDTIEDLLKRYDGPDAKNVN